MNLIDCHDCGNPVSPSARQCPQCGSKELAGPYRPSERAAGRNGIEARNDRTLILMVIAFGAIGAFYGVEINSTLYGKLFFGALYGFVGICAAVPLVFAINLTRHWR
jgi:hypothetical protein